MTEYTDLYHPDRSLLRARVARNAPHPPNSHLIGAGVCIFNAQGEMLIQQRYPSKHYWPNLWDISAGGIAQTAENTKQTAERELHEELGIRHDLGETAPVLTLTINHHAALPCFWDFYLLHADPDLAQLTLQAEEVAAVRWASLADIHALLAAGQFIPYHRGLIEYLYHRAQTGSVYQTPQPSGTSS